MLFAEKVNRILDFNQQLIEKFSAYTNRRVAKKVKYTIRVFLYVVIYSVYPLILPVVTSLAGRLEAVRRLSDCGNKLLSASS